ncbi:MAG: outer membrane protein transport protein [Alphaproteobacteria bacterium]|nr:outer membrane protein transport protein [Alphaproteobacteria bacterium]
MNLKTTLFLTTLFISTVSLAGGYQLQEYSATNAGRAFAGAGIVGDDYSAIAFNPAGMTLKKTGAQLGVMAIDIHSNVHGYLEHETSHAVTKGKRGMIRSLKAIPHGFMQYAFAENWRAGLGLYVPFGLGTYYNKAWFGKTHALNSEIETIDINPSLAWKPFSWLSVGGGAIFERMEARLTNDIGPNGYSDMNADGWGHGWNAGVMIEPAKGTRFGVAYRSKVVQDIKGKHYLKHPNPAIGFKKGISSTKLVDPEHIQFTAYQELGKWGLSAMARWTRWSRFNLLSIDSTALAKVSPLATPSQVDENWRNTWTFSGGVDYHYCKNLTFRTGLAFDQGAVKNAEHRTARVPDTDRWIASVGASYMKNNWQFDLSYFHMFWHKAHVNSKANTTGDTYIKGKYETQINSVGLSVQYHF